jgi:hypothetical protein
MAYLSVGEEGVAESSCQPHNKREQSNEKWSCAQQGEQTTRFRGRHWNAAKMTLRHKTSSQPLPHHRAREGATYLSSTSRTECMSSTATHPPYAANSLRCAGTTCKSCVREEVVSRCRRHTVKERVQEHACGCEVRARTSCSATRPIREPARCACECG